MLGPVTRVLGLVACLCVAWPGVVGAADSTTADRATPDDRRRPLLLLDDGLPWGGHFRIGRAPAGQWDPAGSNWLEQSSGWRGMAPLPAASRAFMTVEAGRDRGGLRGFVSAGGTSETGVLRPRFAVDAYHRWERVGPATNVVARASAGTGHSGDRPFRSYAAASRLSLGSLTLLGRGALVETETRGGPRRSWSGRAEASWRTLGALDTRLAFEWLDPDSSRRGDERSRFGVGVDPLLHPRVRAHVCYRRLSGPAQGRGSKADELAFELRMTF